MKAWFLGSFSTTSTLNKYIYSGTHFHSTRAIPSTPRTSQRAFFYKISCYNFESTPTMTRHAVMRETNGWSLRSFDLQNFGSSEFQAGALLQNAIHQESCSLYVNSPKDWQCTVTEINSRAIEYLRHHIPCILQNNFRLQVILTLQ